MKKLYRGRRKRRGRRRTTKPTIRGGLRVYLNYGAQQEQGKLSWGLPSTGKETKLTKARIMRDQRVEKGEKALIRNYSLLVETLFVPG